MSLDFTEERYAEILDLASSKFSFHLISQIPETSIGTALWRHDVDFSPQRALAMAKMESERNIVATYYVQPSSRFYSIFEPEIIAILREISAMGHEIGLHFDPSIYPKGDLVSRLRLETNLLSDLSCSEVATFSLHNPTTYDTSIFSDISVDGLINGTSPTLREHYTYCSDSNGIWRFTPLIDVLLEPSITSVYILTHPVWWTVDDMVPREKVKRSIVGRANTELKYYDELLLANDRPNIGK